MSDINYEVLKKSYAFTIDVDGEIHKLTGSAEAHRTYSRIRPHRRSIAVSAELACGSRRSGYGFRGAEFHSVFLRS